MLLDEQGPLLRERAPTEPAAQPGSWQAGTQGRTGLAACLGGWSLPSKQTQSVGRTASTAVQQEQQGSLQRGALERPAGNSRANQAEQNAVSAADAGRAQEVRHRRQAFLDSLQQNGEPATANGSRSSTPGVGGMHDGVLAAQHAAYAGKQQGTFAQLEEPGRMLLDRGGSGEVPDAEGSQQIGAKTMAEGSGIARQQAVAAGPSSSRQGEQQEPASSSGAQDLQPECRICFTPMHVAMVRSCGLWDVLRSHHVSISQGKQDSCASFSDKSFTAAWRVQHVSGTSSMGP